MRTPTQILTSIATATSAFALPLALATIAPDLPAHPTIEPMLHELELMVALAQEEPEPEPAEASEPSEPQAQADTTDSKGGGKQRPQPELDDAGSSAAEASAETVRKYQARGSIYARVATETHVRPDRTLASSPRRTTRKSSRRKACVEPVAGIVETAPHRYSVERDLVDYYASHLKQSEQLASTSWHKKDGKVDGFRVKKVRCGSPLHQLGFRNGDVITSVDGKPVTSLTQALRAFRKLRKNDTLSVRVTGWKGDRKTLRFRMT